MPIETQYSARDQLLLYSFEQELDRALESYNALQTRINTVIALSGTLTSVLFGVLAWILNFAEKVPAWQKISVIVPWMGVVSALLAWRFARGIRRELIKVLQEASDVETAREEIILIPVKPFHRRLRDEKVHFGANRETWVIMIIAVIWVGYVIHAHKLDDILMKIFH